MKMGSWSIVIPSQGIRLHGDTKKVKDFLNSEIAYFTRLALNGASITLASQSYGSVQLTETATRELSRIVAEVDAEKTEALEQYINDASARQVLVGASVMGKRVEELKQESPSAATMLAAILSPKWAQSSHATARELIAMFRCIALANPAIFAFDDLLDASKSAAESKQAQETSEAAAKKLSTFIEEKTQLISELENLYRKQLTIQEPAILWQNIAAQKTRVWRVWLGLFALMIAALIAAALANWDTVATAVGKIAGSSSGGLSIAGLAVISVPALLYAWLLKNISRVFNQNLNLADDADHRRSLALTYMGLLQDDKHLATDQDRAIILNALFRPIPPHTGDEGPPSGLIDLIKK
jgi:hypothetical protein